MRERWTSKPAPVLLGGAAALLVGFVAFLCAVVLTKTAPPSPKSLDELKAKVAGLEEDLESEAKRLADSRGKRTRLEAVLADRHDERARLVGRLDARRAELARLEKSRDVKAHAAQQQVKDTQAKAEEELQQALKTEARLRQEAVTQAQLEKTLAESRFNVVQILSLDPQASLGSGFFMNEDARRRDPWVVTTQRVVPTDGPILVRLNAMVGQQKAERDVTLQARTAYRDKQTRLVFLRLLSPPRLGVHSYTPQGFCDVTAGEHIYAIGMQGVVGAILDNSVMEGNVGALEREFEGRTYLQLNLPANLGSSGAAVINRQGQLAGVLMAPLEGLERTSVAVSAAQLKGAMDRYTGRAPQTTTRPEVARSPEKGADARPDEENRPPAPYDENKAIPCRLPQREGQEIFPGPGNLLIVYDEANRIYSAYRSGNPKKPAWTLGPPPGGRNVLLPLDAPGAALLIAHPETATAVSQLDLRTGRTSREWRIAGRFPTPPWPASAVLSFGNWVIVQGAVGVAFDHSRRTHYYWPDRNIRAVARAGSDVWFTRNAGDHVELAAIPAAQVLAYLRQRKSLAKLEMTDPRAQRARTQCDEQFAKAGRTLATMPLDPSIHGRLLLRLPGDRTFVWGRTVYDLKRDPPARGQIHMPAHSKRDEAEFRDAEKLLSPPHSSLDCPLDASPDGRWLLLPAHLADARTLKPVAELPLPFDQGGFVSDSKTIYVVDRRRNMIGFWSVAELLKKFPVKDPGDR